MAVGLELRRPGDNALILSNNIKNPIVTDSGSLNSVANSLTLSGIGSQITVPATGKIRAIRSSVPATRWAASSYVLDAPTGTNIPYYHFSDPTNVYTNVGLEIYADAPGLPIVFSTNTSHKPLRVVAAYDDIGHPIGAPGAAVQIADLSALVTAGRVLAFAQGLFSGCAVWENGAINPSTGFADDNYWAKINYARTFYITAAGLLMADYIRTDPPTTSFSGTGPSVNKPGANDFWDRPMLLVVDVRGY